MTHHDKSTSEALGEKLYDVFIDAVAILQLIPTLDKSSEDFLSFEDERDEMTRIFCHRLLTSMGVYDAGGCPLCLS